jgi:hypothetical protein
MTPYELALFIEAHYESQIAETQEKLTMVWLGEYYHRVKRLPKLKDELRKIAIQAKKISMSDDEMLETVKRLNAEFGGIQVEGGE